MPNAWQHRGAPHALSTGSARPRGYPQCHGYLLGGRHSRSSVTGVDLLQRYRLRQLTRAVYDSADHDDSENPDGRANHASRSQARRLLDYPAALVAIVACVLFLVVMVVRSAAWGVQEETYPSAESHDVAGQMGQGDSAESSSAEYESPPGQRRRSQSREAPQSVAPLSITVHIEGAISQPGIVTLPSGSRVHEAVQAAGGATAEAALREINLARKLADGEYLYVPHIGEDTQTLPAPAQAGTGGVPAVGSAPNSPAQTSGAAPGASAAGCVDINAADLAGLQVLNGVGPALAQRILEARESRGPFLNVDDIDAVSGIGPALMRRIEPQLCSLGGG